MQEFQEINHKLESELQTLRIQNEQLIKRNYASPHFAQTGELQRADLEAKNLDREAQEMDEQSELPESIHGEDTFGNAEQLQRQFAQTQSKLM